MCVRVFTVGQRGHTDHYVFVCHDDGLGIFAAILGTAARLTPDGTPPSQSISLGVYLFHCVHMDFKFTCLSDVFQVKFCEPFLMTACVGKVSTDIKCNTIKTHANSTMHKCNIRTWI